jgi:uncharacterized protein YecE (DUF72 family)
VAEALKTRLGPILFQLPPNMKKDAVRLGNFLNLLPNNQRAAFEFRHQSWFDDEVLDLLREHDAALCIAQAEDELDTPLVATTTWGYLRLRLPNYTPAAMKTWHKRISTLNWREAFIFFKHEEAGKGPQFASKFLALAAKQ